MAGIGPIELLVVLAIFLMFIVVPIGIVIWAFMDKARRDRERERDG